MGTITISETKYKTLKREAAAYRRILSAPKDALHRFVHKPNKETLRTVRALRAGKGKLYTGDTKEIFDALVRER